MKKLFLLPLFALSVITASAQAPTVSGGTERPGPTMKFEELDHNFGTIKQGESVTYIFKFKNDGKEPLIINTAVGSCGCTVPEYPKEPIRPNGAGEIKVTFNSTGKSGPQDKTVTITYDTDKTVVLHMRGTVEVPAPAPAPATPAQAPTQTAKPAASPAPAPAPTAKPAPAPAPAPTAQPKVIATPAPAATRDAQPAPAPAEKPKY
jgi:pyruvate/2-oxoglutarate dehydrogenase complex dihydrolipoamide acyltransferase (E2) component